MKLFGVGTLGWLIGTLIVFGVAWPLAHPESMSSAVIWTIFHGWISFLFGLVALVAYGIVKRLPVGRGAFGYVLPVALLAVIGGLCLLVYPDNLLREELLTYLPVVLLFYGLGLLWIWLRKDAAETPAVARAVIPAVIGGLVILGFVAVPVFASDAFRYRDAFQLTVSKTGVQEGVMAVDASIEIRKAGNYQFSAPRYVWTALSDGSTDEPEVEQGELKWGAAGAPQNGSLGTFPLQIIWRKGIAPAGTPEMMPEEDYLCVEVRNQDEGSKVIHSMSAPMQRH